MSYGGKYSNQQSQVGTVDFTNPNPYGEARRCHCGKKLSFYNHENACFACQRRLEARKPLRTDVKLHSKPHRGAIPALQAMIEERDPPILP